MFVDCERYKGSGKKWMGGEALGFPGDIGIPNGPARNSTRGLLKAQYPKNKKTRKPKDIIKRS
jgi:hypothetical protein